VKKLGRPCDTDAGETRKLLVKEARRSFADVGYDATTNRALMSAKDPSLASFVVGVASESQRHPELSLAIAPLRVGLGQFLSKMCTDAVARGEIVPGINAQVLQDLINVVLTGLSRFSIAVNDQQRGLDVIEGLKRIVAGTAQHASAK